MAPLSIQARVSQRWLHGSALAILLILLTTIPAGAHAAYEGSTPAEGGVVSASPEQITVSFTEPLERSYSRLQLFDAQGAEVQRTTLREGDDEYSMVLEVPPDLPNGTYSVLWRTLSTADGHTAQNYFTFTIGADTDVMPVAIPSSGEQVGGPPQWLKTVSRWAALAGLASLLAVWPVWSAIVRPALGPVWRSAPAIAWRVTRFALVATLLAIAGSVFALVVQAMTLPDGTLLDRVLNTLGQTRYGQLWLARMGLIVLTGLTLSTCAWWFPRRQPLSSLAAWAMCLALPVPFSLIAHASALTAGRAVAIAADAIHLLAAALWIGGLFVLALVLFPTLRGRSVEQRRAVLTVAIPRFSAMALICWAAMGITGFYAGWLHVGNLDALTTTDYGRALLVKLGLLAVVLAIAATNLLVIERRIGRVTPAGRPVWSARLRWTVTAECVLVLGVLMAVGQMTSLQPARDAVAEGAHQSSVAFVLDNGTAELMLAPGIAGMNHFRVDVADGQLTPDTEALLRVTMPDRDDMGTRELQLARVSDTAFEHHGSELGIAGEWEIELILREQGAAPVSAVAEQEIGATAPGGDVPAEPWRFESFGGVSGLLLVIIGAGSVIVAISTRQSMLRKEWGGMGVAALALGTILLLQARVDPVLASAGGANGPADAAMLARGEEVYATHCLSCHGADLRGSGPEGTGMQPPPADFSQPHTRAHAIEDLVYWIRYGKQGTGMPGFDAVLTDGDIWDVLRYIESEQERFEHGPHHAGS